MATQQRSSDETEARGQEIRTLVIAAVASGLAAVIVSQFWFAGTWIAAALTPIVVTIVRELLERPTSKIAERVTADRPAVQPRVVMPPDEEPRVEPGAGDRRMDEPAPIRVYGKSQRTGQPSRKRKLALRAAVVTGLLGFVIAFSVITITDLVAGKSVTGSDKRLTFGGGKSDKKDSNNATDTTGQDQGQDSEQQQTQPQDSDQQQTQPQEQQQTAPRQTTPQTTPTTPTTTTPGG